MGSEDVQKMIEGGVFKNIDSFFDMQKDASKFLPHICNERCKICTGSNEYRCRKWNNRLKTERNTKNTLNPMIYHNIVYRLAKIGIYEPLESNNDGTEASFKCSN